MAEKWAVKVLSSILEHPVFVMLCYVRSAKYLKATAPHTHLVASSSSLRLNCSDTSDDLEERNSATCLAGNSDSQTYPKSLARWIASPEKYENIIKKVLKHQKGNSFKFLFIRFTLKADDMVLILLLCWQHASAQWNLLSSLSDVINLLQEVIFLPRCVQIKSIYNRKCSL